MAGIKEIAAHSGVSIATVSRALRGLHHVNPETRAKIIDAANVLGYPIEDKSAPPAPVRTNSVGIVAPYI